MNLFFLSHKRRKSPDHSFFFFSFFFFSPRALFLGRKMRSKRKNFLDESQSVGKLQQITLKREIFRVFTKHPCSDRLSATFYDTFVDFNPLFIQNICNFQLREFFRGTQKKSLENFPLFFAEMIERWVCERVREDFSSRSYDRFFFFLIVVAWSCVWRGKNMKKSRKMH